MSFATISSSDTPLKTIPNMIAAAAEILSVYEIRSIDR
jgi:hypothetical protein